MFALVVEADFIKKFIIFFDFGEGEILNLDHLPYPAIIFSQNQTSSNVLDLSSLVFFLQILQEFFLNGNAHNIYTLQIHKIAKIADDFYVLLKGYASDP